MLGGFARGTQSSSGIGAAVAKASMVSVFFACFGRVARMPEVFFHYDISVNKDMFECMYSHVYVFACLIVNRSHSSIYKNPIECHSQPPLVVFEGSTLSR